jgi:O-antigen/teichoic acid export membrane protein
MGILAVLSLVTAFCAALDGSAYQQAATKFIGELSANHKEIASAVFYQTLRISMLVSVPLAAIIFLYAPTLASGMLGTATDAYLFKVLAVDILISAGALPVAIGTLFGLQRFKASSIIGVVGALLRQCLIILLIVFLKNFVGLVIAWVLSDLATFTAYGLYILRVVGRPGGSFSVKKLLHFSWPLNISGVITFGYSWFDRALLVVFVPLATLGAYNAALTAFGAMAGFSSPMANVLLPTYSGISGRDRLESCRSATRLASRYVSLTMVPLAFGLLATARPALTLFVGKAYADGTLPLMILSLAFGVTVFAVGVSPMMLAISETRLYMAITVVSVVLGLMSASILLPIMGIVGASVARGVAMVASTGLMLVVLSRKKAMALDVEAIWKSLVAGALMAIILFGAQMVAYNRLLLPGYVVLGGATYLVTLRLLKTVRKEDVNLMDRFLGSKLRFATKLLEALVVSG